MLCNAFWGSGGAYSRPKIILGGVIRKDDVEVCYVKTKRCATLRAGLPNIAEV